MVYCLWFFLICINNEFAPEGLWSFLAFYFVCFIAFRLFFKMLCLRISRFSSSFMYSCSDLELRLSLSFGFANPMTFVVVYTRVGCRFNLPSLPGANPNLVGLSESFNEVDCLRILDDIFGVADIDWTREGVFLLFFGFSRVFGTSTSTCYSISCSLSLDSSSSDSSFDFELVMDDVLKELLVTDSVGVTWDVRAKELGCESYYTVLTF